MLTRTLLRAMAMMPNGQCQMTRYLQLMMGRQITRLRLARSYDEVHIMARKGDIQLACVEKGM
jgi:hypothetical protein